MLLTISMFMHFLLGYVFGSIPFGLILTAKSNLGDIRKIGSGNIGATNVLRTGNKTLAAATLLLDCGKSAVAIYLWLNILSMDPDFTSYYNSNTKVELLFIGLGSVIGHCFPIWLRFKGGKGVATALGVFLAAVPYAGLAACAAWIITAKITRISSLSALVAVGIAPIVTLFIYGAAPAGICALITLLVWVRHKDNIKRLLKGEEPKIGADKKNKEM